jgi:hypothetical protein
LWGASLRACRAPERAKQQEKSSLILLKLPDLSEPTQSALYFFLFYLMPAGEALKTHTLKSGPLQGRFHPVVILRFGNVVTLTTAQPDGNLEKMSARSVVSVGFTQPILIDTAKKESDRFDRSGLGKHRS